MAVQDISSRLFNIKGEGKLETAYSTDFGTSDETDKSSSLVKSGRCLYLVRLELSSEGHPEIKDDKFSLSIRTTKNGIEYQKGLGGGRRGWVGEEISFENLIEKAHFPNERTNEPAPFDIRSALDDILKGYHYNCNFKVYSEFDGYKDGFLAKFDKLKTYMPIIIRAVKEVQTKL